MDFYCAILWYSIAQFCGILLRNFVVSVSLGVLRRGNTLYDVNGREIHNSPAVFRYTVGERLLGPDWVLIGT